MNVRQNTQSQVIMNNRLPDIQNVNIKLSQQCSNGSS